ncbi:SAM-dependent methyltransferase [Afifella aestuarii]|uniref:SAM-dependent methyltransferase n=1 Tax=Afifella aestuarii TaxID=1909496 RepID=UPI000FE3009B|nr:cyclopropane-fatty-acyl-phospholipid synthase family protein [Afifella aestuarii]
MSHAERRSSSWPALPAALWSRLARQIVDRIAVGELTLHFPDGSQMTAAGAAAGPHAVMHIHRGRFFLRLLNSGAIGLAEGYIAEDWSSPDLEAVLELALLNEPAVGDAVALNRLQGAWERLRHLGRANTRRGSRRNIAAHYDLGNEFYRRWLDETMTYSAALFARSDVDLAEAQRAKYRRIIDILKLKPGERVLEIGCGWGGFAEIAAKEADCHVTGLTLSREQAAFARERLAGAGLGEKTEIRLEDYRDTAGSYDKIVSIEMFEAVGEANWATFFNVVHRRLKENGRALIQVITMDEGRFQHYRKNVDFIQRYVFPGGMLPPRSAFESHAREAGFEVGDAFFFGRDYAETLRRWEKAFLAHWPAVSELGFDERFRRLWRYYLTYCAVGFKRGRVDVGQFLLARG